MSDMHDFLVEHAKFPFPQLNEGLSGNTTDISLIEVALLENGWKAKHAVRDDNLVQKLCNTLEDILGDTLLEADDENELLSRFSPRVQFGWRGHELHDWRVNPSESHVSVLTPHSRLSKSGSSSEQSRFLLISVLRALNSCLWICGPYVLVIRTEQVADQGCSKVDYVLEVDGEYRVLIEAKSPSVMNSVGVLLPPNGIELTWVRGRALAPKMLSKVRTLFSSPATLAFEKYI